MASPPPSRATNASRVSAVHGSGTTPTSASKRRIVGRGERDAEVRGIGRGPQHQRRVGGGVGVGEQCDLAVAQHHAR